MHVESVYQHAWNEERPVSHWFEYLKINGGAARIVIVVNASRAKAVLSLWTLERGYRPFVVLPEPDVVRGNLEVTRNALLEVAEQMLRTTRRKGSAANTSHS